MWGEVGLPALPCPGVPTSDPSPETRRRIDHADPRRWDGGGDLGDSLGLLLSPEIATRRRREAPRRIPEASFLLLSLDVRAGRLVFRRQGGERQCRFRRLSFLSDQKEERARAESLNGARVAPLYPHWTTRPPFFFFSSSFPCRTDAASTGQSPTCRCSDLAGALSKEHGKAENRRALHAATALSTRVIVLRTLLHVFRKASGANVGSATLSRNRHLEANALRISCLVLLFPLSRRLSPL